MLSAVSISIYELRNRKHIQVHDNNNCVQEKKASFS